MNKSNAGFTLVEVMVAVAVIAITLPALLFTMQSHIDNASYLRDKLEAQWVAENQLVQQRLNNRLYGSVSKGERGKETLGSREWKWEVKTKKFPQEEFSDIFGIEVSVWHGDANPKDDPLIIVYGVLRMHGNKGFQSLPAPDYANPPAVKSPEGET